MNISKIPSPSRSPDRDDSFHNDKTYMTSNGLLNSFIKAVSPKIDNTEDWFETEKMDKIEEIYNTPKRKSPKKLSKSPRHSTQNVMTKIANPMTPIRQLNYSGNNLQPGIKNAIK